jgi:hypothetical protein
MGNKEQHKSHRINSGQARQFFPDMDSRVSVRCDRLVLRGIPALPGVQPGCGFHQNALIERRGDAGRIARKQLVNAPYPHTQQDDQDFTVWFPV